MPKSPDEQVVLGGDVTVEGSWVETCSESHVTGLKDTSSHDAPGIGLERESRSWDCNAQPFHVELSCTGPCDHDRVDEKFTGRAAVKVSPTKLGIMTVRMEMIHADTNEHRTRERVVEVVLPDKFTTQCMNPTHAWGACTAGLAASDPQIRVFPMLGMKIVRSSLLRVDGHPAPSLNAFTTGVSLADLLGGPLAPGPRELVISVGDKQQVLAVDIH